MTDWHDISTAPRDGKELVNLKLESGFELRAFWLDGLVGKGGETVACWAAEVDEGYPDSWTDGVCWEVNERGVQSDPPTHWRPINTGAEG